MAGKTGVLLVQLGTPDSYAVRDVWRYLREFLTDKRVIDLPWLQRQLLINLIIVPFRSSKSAKLYKEIWTKEGSPLMFYAERLTASLQQALGDDYMVRLVMRYQNPSIASVLEQLEKERPSRLVILPLFPQSASSTTSSAAEEIFRNLAKWEIIPPLRSIGDYYAHPEYIRLWAEKGRAYDLAAYDRIMFTFHGIPWRHIRKSGCAYSCGDEPCPPIDDKNHTCYRAQCYANAQAVIEALRIPAEKAIVSFQSRLGKDPWITPYTDKMLEKFAKEGVKKVLVFSMSFTADCLETIHEMGVENQHLFEQAGGEKIELIPGLNVDTGWLDFLKNQVLLVD